MKKRSKRRLIRYGLVFGNVAILVGVAFFVLHNRGASQTVRRSSLNSAIQTVGAASQNPLDELSSAEIAVQAAQLTGMPELTAVRNQADSENAQLAIVPSDTSIVAKPQIVSTAQKSKKNITKYKTVAGDTVSSIASKFGINANSIKWSNNLSGETVAVNAELIIPPDNGVVYRVKSGDTIDSITSKYQANKALFVTVNDAEDGKLTPNEYVWIPGGVQPVAVTRFSQPRNSSGFAWGGAAAVYGSNGYDYGYCTWYVANKRAGIGKPVPSNLGNASTWKVLAQRAGLPTGPTPQPGAVAWKVPRDYYGHVAYVEEVYPDGSMKISEMNVAGWNRISSTVVPASGIGTYYFIY